MERSIFDNADARAAKTGDSLMLSEFGATDDISILERIAGYADRHMTSWQEWHYCGCDDPTTSGPGDVQAIVKNPQKPPRGSNVFWGKLKALARPYPQAIAGTPIRFASTRTPEVRAGLHDQAGQRPTAASSSGLTEVFVPQHPVSADASVSSRRSTVREAAGRR